MNTEFADKPDDPIPRVGVIDVISELDNGDRLCGLVIARPIGHSKETLRRLVQKVHNYAKEFAPIAKTNRVRVDFVVHPETSAEAMRVIKECGALLERSSIQFTITLLDPDTLPPLPHKIDAH